MRATPVLVALGLIGAASLSAQTAPAQEEPIQLAPVASTGSRFHTGRVLDSPVPIDVITSTELRQGGHTEFAQALQSLAPSFNFPRPSLSDGTDHVRPATLRGLAPDHVLVLVNGKRRHTSALVNLNSSVGRGSVSLDFNALPLSAIDRVEVLRDGASAQYGSDAIAGVINVILRRDTGRGFDVTYGATGEGDGRDLQASAFAGTKLGTAGTLFVTAYARERSPGNRLLPDTRQQYFGIGAGGALLPISGNYGSGTGLTPTGGGTLDPREATVNRLNHRFGDPRTKERGVFVNAELPVAGYTAYFFGGATQRHAESAGFFRRPGDDRTVRALWPNGFLPIIQSNISDLSAGAGLKGHLGAWQFDASTVLGSNALALTIAQSNNVTLGAASPRSFYAGTLTFLQHTTNLDFARELTLAFRAPLRLALGGEFRHEHYDIRAGTPDSYRDGGVRILDGPNAGAVGAPGVQVFPGFRPGDAGRHERDAFALYLDADQAVTERWRVSGAVRFEHYNDFGSQTTAKLATHLQLTTPFALRGSIGTGFRAPHVAQQWFSSTATNFINGVPFENKTFPVTDPIARALGAEPLKPETSRSASVGLTWQPAASFAASLDVYQVAIDDRVVLSSNFLGTPGSAFVNYLSAAGHFGTTGGRYFTNAVDTRTRGVDVTARHVWRPTPASRLTLSAGFNANQTKATRIKATPPQLAAVGIVTPLFDLTERIRMERGQPRHVLNLAANYDAGRWSFLLRQVHYGSVEAVSLASATPAQVAALLPTRDITLYPSDPVSANQQIVQRYGARWITDLVATLRWSKALTFALGANNLFDVHPDRAVPTTVVNGTVFAANDNQGGLPYLQSPSPFGFSGAFYHGRVSWKF